MGRTAFDDLEDDAAFNATRGKREPSPDTGEGDADFYNTPIGGKAPFQMPTDRAPLGAERFACQSCGGTGRWSGGRNQNGETKCFACKGAGYFKTSRADRERARTLAKQRKGYRVQQGAAAFKATYPGLVDQLETIKAWNQFAGSLLADFAKYGQLTGPQVESAYKVLAKIDAGRAASAEKAATVSGEVDVSKVKAMFDRAAAKGLKRPSFVCEGIVLSRAPDTGKNPGAIYVKVAGEYAGKILDGRFAAVGSAPQGTVDLIGKVAADPLGEAIRYGRLTGACACCGRQLTDPESVERGIGPICADKWFGA